MMHSDTRHAKQRLKKVIAFPFRVSSANDGDML